MDLSNWMGNLEPQIRNRPIIFLAIPGSHDSLSYSINVNSPVGPDSEPAVKTLIHTFGPVARKFIFKWCVTQNRNITDQLNSGVRYFDIRVATKENDKDLYFTHGLYGEKVVISLANILSFLEEHEDEIVIIDFQHFYNVSREEHKYFTVQLEEIFGSLLCPLPQNISDVTLDWMKENRYKVIVIYRNDIVKEKKMFWPSHKWPTPWPETMSCRTLIAFLDNTLNKRPTNAGFVSQCILTPTKYTVLQLCSELHSKCAWPAASVCIPWLSKHPPGQINVALADFILDKDSLFPRTVIALNHSSTE